MVCLVTVFTSLKKDGKAVYHKGELLVIAVALAIILSSLYLLGMLPTLGLFVVLWLRLVEKTPWKTTLIILAIVAAIVLGVFVFWLGVRFPKGAILNAIMS